MKTEERERERERERKRERERQPKLYIWCVQYIEYYLLASRAISAQPSQPKDISIKPIRPIINSNMSN